MHSASTLNNGNAMRQFLLEVAILAVSLPIAAVLLAGVYSLLLA